MEGRSMKHHLYNEFMKATAILRARGLKVEGPDADGFHPEWPGLIVMRDDFPVRRWFTYEANPKGTFGSLFNPGSDEIKSSEEGEWKADLSTARKIVNAYDRDVRKFVTGHNKDRADWKKEMLSMGDPEWRAEQSAMTFMGEPYRVEPE